MDITKLTFLSAKITTKGFLASRSKSKSLNESSLILSNAGMVSVCLKIVPPGVVSTSKFVADHLPGGFPHIHRYIFGSQRALC